MANATPSRIGQVNGSGDVDALFLKVFSGEVLTSFYKQTIMMPRVTVRTISHGKSASFPAVGRTTASYHTPGAELTGSSINHNEVVIPIDGLLVADTFVANIDEAMNHYDVRGPYSEAMGRALAEAADENILKEFVAAARKSANLGDTGYAGGTQIKNDAFKLDPDSSETGTSTTRKDLAVALASGLFEAAQQLDENFAPRDGRYAVFSPREYWSLALNTDLINNLYGGSGSIREGQVFRIAGFDILMSPSVPHSDTSGSDTKHGIDADQTVAVCGTSQAVGVVKLMDISSEMAYDIRRQGTLLVSKFAMGFGPLRPECAIELMTETSTITYNS